MKKEKKQINKTGRAFFIMLFLLIPVFLFLSLLSMHFALKRETEQENMKRSALVNIVSNEQLENLTAEKQFDEKLSALLQLMTDSLKEFITEDGYTGPRMFTHGFVAELKDSRIVVPDEIPGGELLLTGELVEESIASGKKRTGSLITDKGIAYYLSFGVISDDIV